jgi:hypothetical protein
VILWRGYQDIEGKWKSGGMTIANRPEIRWVFQGGRTICLKVVAFRLKIKVIVRVYYKAAIFRQRKLPGDVF